VVTFTYTSSCSPLTTTCTATFTVAAPPTVQLTCPINTTVGACQTQAAINAQFNAWLATASASGGCNGVLTNNNQGAPSNCGGNTVVTFTYTSSCFPFTTTCTATFTVAAPPTVQLTCPAPMVMNPCSTQAQVNAAYAAWLASATASGGCNGVLTNNNTLAAPTICNTGSVTRTVTWTYTSTCSPFTTTCTSTFTLPAYPDFTVPANGAATVACPAQATQPVPPVVLNGCGGVITPTGPVVTNNPNPLTCEGTRTYTWTYTDCAGRARTWSFVYTVERLDFTVPANGGATVACPDQTDVVPTPPVVLSNCGEVLTPVLINTDEKPFCEGVRRYTWRYTDCEGNSHDWSFVYTVVYEDFTIPPSVIASIECPQAVVVPIPPTVFDNCGVELVPVGPSISYTYNAFGCEATRTYSFVYTDCSGFSHTWAYTYSFEYEGDFAVYGDEYNEVSCIKHAVEPIPPTIYDNCGSAVSVWLSGVWEDIDPLGCMGTRIYTFTYRDCGGHTHDWKFTYFVKDNIAPMGTIPDVDEEVTCLEDVPCPDDDFSAKMAQIIAEGDFYDNCKEPIIMLDSWTELWPCSDDDGDGVYTFGRTYYFVVKDICGNAYPELIPVTYYGECQPIGNFSMMEWGNEGGEPAASVSGATGDLQVIQQLLGSGSIKIGGANRSLTVSDAQCVMNLLPGVGGPSVLRNCHQINCMGCNEMGVGGMKNALAANAIALELNIRFGIQYNGITRAEALANPLDCINLHPCITNCNEQGVCYLRIFDAFGEEYAFPYTVGGLQDLVNLYLNGNLDLSGGLGVIYGTALNQSLLMLNTYGNDEMLARICTNDAMDLWSNAFDGIENLEGYEWAPDFKLAPNPAYNEFNFRLAKLGQPADVVLTIYNSLGQAVQILAYDQVEGLNETIRIDGLQTGLYFVDVKIGAKHYNTRLVVQR
jgi:Secretion system C-terminal sorting domain